MSTGPRDQESSQMQQQPEDPFAAAQRYQSPRAGRPTAWEMPEHGVAWVRARATNATQGSVVESSLPRVLGGIGIVCAFVLMPLGLVLGIVGHYLARRYGQPVALPRFAWILSIATTLLGVMINLAAHAAFRLP